jgi:hypothetical protein
VISILQLQQSLYPVIDVRFRFSRDFAAVSCQHDSSQLLALLSAFTISFLGRGGLLSTTGSLVGFIRRSLFLLSLFHLTLEALIIAFPKQYISLTSSLIASTLLFGSLLRLTIFSRPEPGSISWTRHGGNSLLVIPVFSKRPSWTYSLVRSRYIGYLIVV